MGATPEKVAALLRGMTRPPLPCGPEHRPPPRASFESRSNVVVARIGDDVVWNCVAPSTAAARAIAQAMRDLQQKRGTVF